MYEAGLTLSALNGQPMDDALIPPMDNSAEAVARRKLYAACLSKSAQDGEKQAVPYADWSAEKQAEYKLQAADLTTQGSAADTVSADMTQVDALFRCNHYVHGGHGHRQQFLFLCNRGALRRVTSRRNGNLWQKLIF